MKYAKYYRETNRRSVFTTKVILSDEIHCVKVFKLTVVLIFLYRLGYRYKSFYFTFKCQEVKNAA